MSEQRIEAQPPIDEGVEVPVAAAKAKKTLDPGAKRNLMIVGGVTLAAVAVVGFVGMRLASGPQLRETGLPATQVQTGSIGAQSTPTGDLTPEDLQRLDRVTQRQAEEAAAAGRTFIPSNLPLNREPASPEPAPLPAQAPPPGVNYSVSGGQAGMSQADAERFQLMLQGLERQLTRIAEVHAAPPTVSAARYESRDEARQPAVAQQTVAAEPASMQTGQAAVAAPLVEGLHLAAAELLSPIDTDKTSFVSARMASGPLAGATLYGVVQMVSDQGVRVRFNRMLAQGRSYSINAIALDPAVSHDTLSADIDRKVLERYVLPLIGDTAKAFLQAIGQAGQQVVVGPGNTPVVVQPEASTRQAAAQGAAAGIDRAMEEFGRSRSNPRASLPAGAPIGVLFLDPVEQPLQGPAAVGNWAPAATPMGGLRPCRCDFDG